MGFEEFKDKLFRRAAEEGFSMYEIYYADGESFRVNIYKGEIDQYSVNTHIGLSFRGLYNGKMGYAYTQVMDDEAIDFLVYNAKENARSIEKEDLEEIYGGGGEYASMESYSEELEKVDAQQKIDLALKLEKETYLQSDKVKTTTSCAVSYSQGRRRIINSLGLDLQHRSNIMTAVVVPVVREGEKTYTAGAVACSRRMEEIDPSKLARESVGKALAQIGAQTIKSGVYKTAILNEAAGDLLATFAGIFSADNAQKGLSLLKGKVDSAIGSPELTIIDDPLMKDGVASTPFDDEGVPTKTKEVVENGVLRTLLHNMRTAAKEGIPSTGNGTKPSVSSPIGVSPFNFFIKPGRLSFEELLKVMGDGVLITDLQGLHSGAHAVSGDFSLAARGFLVKNGKIDMPVEQITVAGNFFQLMKDVLAVASDLDFFGGSCGSPTLLVSQLSIAGK